MAWRVNWSEMQMSKDRLLLLLPLLAWLLVIGGTCWELRRVYSFGVRCLHG